MTNHFHDLILVHKGSVGESAEDGQNDEFLEEAAPAAAGIDFINITAGAFVIGAAGLAAEVFAIKADNTLTANGFEAGGAAAFRRSISMVQTNFVFYIHEAYPLGS